LKKKKKLDKKWNDLYSLQKVQEDLTNDRIKIVKYNYALEKETQNFDSQFGFIEIKGDYMKLFNINQYINHSKN
jgi:hypothetical protein